MALITRLNRLFKADFHAVLDQIEDPDLQLRQAVREMQFALDQDQQRLKLLEHEAEQIEKTEARLEQTLIQYDEELDLCFSADKEELARDLVRRKLADEKRRLALGRQIEVITAQIETLRQQIEEHQQQLASMKQKLELLVGSEPGFDNSTFEADSIRNEEIEIALLREKQRRTQA